MSVSAELVRTWDTAACDRQARRLFHLADDLDRAYERLCRTEVDLTGWHGSAADRGRMRIRLAAVAASRLAAGLRQAADVVRSALAGLTEAVRLVRASAQSPEEGEEAVALALSVDRRVAAGLIAVAADVHRRSTGSPAALTLPGPGATPAEVARWWTGLRPDLRRRALTEHASALGQLAGLPASARDTANRLLLGQRLRLLRAERDRLVVGLVPTAPADRRWAASVRTMLAVAESVERELAALQRSGTPARLLTFDLEGAGRVAIGLGDIDRARHVAVVVPGMGQDAAHGVGRTVGQAARLRDEAGADTAAVAWIGYAAPGWAEVPFPTRARAGGRSLAADLRALAAGRTADGGDPPHVTVVGHSYGSTVVGAAATADRLEAGDLVLLGSPGVLVEHADELGLRRGHVFVGEAPLDPVADLGVFGADPGDAEFGAVRIGADPGPGVPWPERLTGGDHSHYLDQDSESLRNVARVVVGRRADISGPCRGEAP